MKQNNSLHAEKQRKLQELKDQGVVTYAHRFQRTHTAADVLDRYDHLVADEQAADRVRVCGRIMRKRYSWRFVDLEDQSGSIQLIFEENVIGAQAAKRLRLMDRGDIIGVCGRPMRTRQGPPSILVEEWEILAKSMQPIPD